MVDQGALMEFLRLAVTETAANTYAEDEASTPVSRSEELAMLIWRIEWIPDRPDLIDAVVSRIRAQLTDESFTALQVSQSPSILSGFDRTAETGAAQGSLSEYSQIQTIPDPLTQIFQPPFLYTKRQMFLGMQGTANSGAKFTVVKVGYTLEKVPTAQFIAALVE